MKSFLMFLLLCYSGVATAEVKLDTKTDTPVNISLENGSELEQEGRRQLERLLADHDLDPWIFTQEVRIESFVIPHSHPVLTLNTRYTDDDLKQLAAFVHEQAHWFVSEDGRQEAMREAVDMLGKIYPDPPSPEITGTRSETSTYMHLIVNCLELDAMRRLTGEETARKLLAEKNYYRWIYQRVLEDTEAIGKVVTEHDLLILTGGIAEQPQARP